MALSRERKTGLEQHYTRSDVVDFCLKAVVACPELKSITSFLEPSAGTGEFINGLSRIGIKPSSIEAFDIEPKAPGIVKADFLAPDTGLTFKEHRMAIGNPPFGRGNSLAVPFFNKCARYNDAIGFIIPKSWRKWSIQNRLDSAFHLVLDIDLTAKAYYEIVNGVRVVNDQGTLATVFQVWVRRDVPRQRVEVKDNGYIKKVTPTEADVAVTAWGHSLGRVETKFPRVKNTTKLFLKCKKGMKRKVIAALKHIDYKRFSQNTAFTPVISMKEINFLLNEELSQ